MDVNIASVSASAGEHLPPISLQIWDMKYRLKAADGTPIDLTVEDTWRRVACALAAVETEPQLWEERFYTALEDFKFLPAGRIISGAGTDRRVTLFNCFVMGNIEDDLGAIFAHLREAALTMQQGGGIGYDFSSLRPKGAPVHGVGADASGPLSFMDVWDSMCRTIMSAGSRRGAMMATMHCDHPDIEDFVAAKRDSARLRMFNLSVLATDPFMAAVEADAEWPLVFGGVTYRTVRARALWGAIMRSTYDFADPGVIFIDRINGLNNLSYCETIHATNPCGEQPLPPYGACLLGSVNLSRLVRDPFNADAHLDEEALTDLAGIAVRMLDNAIDASGFPLEAQRREAEAKRRIGLGVTGLADALMMVGERYGSQGAAATAERWAKLVNRAAYLASAHLAREKGAFPLFDRDAFLAAPNVQAQQRDVRAQIEKHGIRNGLLTSIAPTGTISLFAGNASSGVEPVFLHTYVRKVRQPDGATREEAVEGYAYRLFHDRFGPDAPLPAHFVTTADLTPDEHIRMQAAVQRHVDAAISKTVNLPKEISFEAFEEVYWTAYRSGCKGCTTFRPNDITGSILSATSDTKPTVADDLLQRGEQLQGTTYKLHWANSGHSYFVTVNHIDVDGVKRPFEVFVASKDPEHQAWIVALTRMVSAVFRRGGNVAFVAEELKQILDPRGGQWAKGRYVPSLVAAIGDILEQHMVAIGFLPRSEAVETNAGTEQADAAAITSLGPACPRCGQPGLIKEEGCLTCLQCSWSKCG